jgi:predicted GIY-YIG superfamily endonuclease
VNPVSYVYRLTFSNGKVYIGKANDPYGRFKDHAACTNNGTPIRMYHAWRKYGAPDIDVIASCFDERFAYEIEKAMILEYYSVNRAIGYNSTFGGDGSRLSEDAQKRQSESLKARYADGSIDKSFLVESGRSTMAKLWEDESFRERKSKAASERMTRLNANPEFKNKTLEMNRSEEHRSKMSELAKRLNACPYHAAKVGNGKARQYAKKHGRPFSEIEFKKNGGIRVISAA